MQAEAGRVVPHVAAADFTGDDTIADETQDGVRNGTLQLSRHDAPQRPEEAGNGAAVLRQWLAL